MFAQFDKMWQVGSSTIVAIEPVEERWAVLLQAGNAGSIGKEDIQEAVIVVVKHGDATQDRIDDGLVRDRAVVEYKIHARSSLPVLETYGWSRPGRPAGSTGAGTLRPQVRRGQPDQTESANLQEFPAVDFA